MDVDQGKLIFMLSEAVDDLARLPREQLLKDSAAIAGAALSLMLIASNLCAMTANKDEAPKAMVN